MRACARSIWEKIAMTDLLQLDGLKAGYGEARVLSGISLSLKDGQSLALLGRNGTGKTTD
jgi:branched-chain amino acid transport system ATP-binding protein